jgi:hypothetical protein
MAIWPPAGSGPAALLLSPRRLWTAILMALLVAGYDESCRAQQPGLSRDTSTFGLPHDAGRLENEWRCT